MTCIVSFIDSDGTIFMGGDSAGVAGLDITIRADEKVFGNSGYLMGFTSSFRMGQLLRYAFNPPQLKLPYVQGRPECRDEDLNRHMVTTFVDGARKCFKDGGYLQKEKDSEVGGAFLVAYMGRVFQIESDFQVGISTKPYDAVGCGTKYALGAFYNMEISGNLSGADRVFNALSAAAFFSGGVAEPFHIMQLTPDGKISVVD